MRVNIYAEEMTNRVELVTKTSAEGTFTGVRFYLYLPVTVGIGKASINLGGPFIHQENDDDSSAITFWGKRDLKEILLKALALLEAKE